MEVLRNQLTVSCLIFVLTHERFAILWEQGIPLTRHGDLIFRELGRFVFTLSKSPDDGLQIPDAGVESFQNRHIRSCRRNILAISL